MPARGEVRVSVEAQVEDRRPMLRPVLSSAAAAAAAVCSPATAEYSSVLPSVISSVSQIKVGTLHSQQQLLLQPPKCMTRQLVCLWRVAVTAATTTREAKSKKATA